MLIKSTVIKRASSLSVDIFTPPPPLSPIQSLSPTLGLRKLVWYIPASVLDIHTCMLAKQTATRTKKTQVRSLRQYLAMAGVFVSFVGNVV